ncbi:TrmH family RNA methyltransferase [Streptomyces noursei]|uniref:TrmH family RNA methyltransferase n=1 Tax=Streptomyces noursei TaxID=1971 RepID=UPI0033F8C7D7
MRTARALGVQDVVLTDGTTDLVGNETEGVSDTVQALADLVVQIPMAGAVESLNVGVTTGVSRGHVAVAADDAADLIITAEGKQAIAALWAVQERTEEALYAGFSATERDQLQGLLRRVQDNALRLARRAGD